MIPASWRRFQLSQLINTALALPRIVPFDFLIRGVLLGGSLSEAANGEVSRTCFLELVHVSDSGETGGNVGDRVYRERHAAHQTGRSSPRGMGLVDILFRTRVCAFYCPYLFLGAP
jgi:NLE (NUC135) domain